MIYWIRYKIFSAAHRLNKWLYYKLDHIFWTGRIGSNRWENWTVRDYHFWQNGSWDGEHKDSTRENYSSCIDCGAGYSKKVIQVGEYKFDQHVPCGCLNVGTVESLD